MVSVSLGGLLVGLLVSRLTFQDWGGKKERERDGEKGRICAVGERLAATWGGRISTGKLT